MRHDNLIQNSPEWYEFRESRLGASDASVICGLSPHKTAHQLWLEKTKQVIPDWSKNRFAMDRGHYLEPIVRGIAGFHLDKTFVPTCFTKDFLMASLDGIWEDSEALEIKHALKSDHDALILTDPKSIPKKYYPQCQHQLYVSNVSVIHYCSYSINFKKEKNPTKGDLKIVPVYRDEEFLKKYIPIAERFMESVTNSVPPEMVNIDI